MTLLERSSKPRAEVERRLLLTELAIVQGRPRAAILLNLQRQFGMSDRQARRYLEVVHKRWLREASAQDRETARARLRQLALHTYNAALSRKRSVAVLSGEGRQVLQEVDDPDFAAAVRAIEVAGKLDGVLAGATVNVNHSTLNVLGNDVIANLRTLYFGPAAAAPQIVDAPPSDPRETKDPSP